MSPTADGTTASVRSSNIRPQRDAAPRARNDTRAGGMIPGVIDELRAAADALNRGDPEPFAELIADECEWRGVPHGHLWWKRTPS